MFKKELKKIVSTILGGRYTKYDNYGDLHWRWYFSNKSNNYKTIVNKSLEIFEPVERGTVLDIRSGDGLVDYLLIKKGFSVTGVEPEKRGNLIAEEKVPDLDIVPLKLKDFLRENNRNFDYLYSLNTIEHIKDYDLFVELMSFVKNFAVIVTDNAEKSLGEEVYHAKEFTFKELQDLFSDFRTEPIDLGTDKYIGLKIYA